MNCKECLNAVGEYVDGELDDRIVERITGHFESCAACENAYQKIQYEQTVYAALGQHSDLLQPRWENVRSRIGAERVVPLTIPTHSWFSRFQFSVPVAAVVLISLASVFLVVTLLMRRSTGDIPSQYAEIEPVRETPTLGVEEKTTPPPPKSKPRVPADRKIFVTRLSEAPLFEAEKFSDAETKTLNHIEKSQMLLRSFKNAPEDIAVEKQRFQKLLNRNVVLRCEAIAKGNLLEEEVLTTLEPILIDIAKLPDHASPADVRSVAETIKKTEIVAMLQGYSQANNR